MWYRKNSSSSPDLVLACGYAFGGSGIDNVITLFAAADEAMYLDKQRKYGVRD